MSNIKLNYIEKSEIDDFARAFLDLETGRHLLDFRTPNQKKAMRELCKAMEKSEYDIELSGREEEILFLQKICTDYDYAVANGLDKLDLKEIAR